MSEVKKYIKEPIVIEAIKLNQYTIDECYQFMGIVNKGNFTRCGNGIDPADGKFKITTLEGVMIVNLGDYIIKGIKGEFYPCQCDIFESSYERVN